MKSTSGTTNDPHDDLATRVMELEIRTSYQDRLIETLDEVVRTFALRVEMLEQETRTLRASLDSAPTVGPADEKPPHY